MRELTEDLSMLPFRTLVGNPGNQKQGRPDKKELVWPWPHIRPPFWFAARDDPTTNYYRGRMRIGCRFVAPCASISSGSIVRIRNLVSRQELNGQVATCLRWINENARWRVRLMHGGDEIDIKLDNISEIE